MRMRWNRSISIVKFAPWQNAELWLPGTCSERFDWKDIRKADGCQQDSGTREGKEPIFAVALPLRVRQRNGCRCEFACHREYSELWELLVGCIRKGWRLCRWSFRR